MRYSTDFCLLCLSNAATKTSSHIIPRFLSTDFLGSKDSRKGFQLYGDKPVDQSPKTVQDSPKEDFILCEDCEKYFSILEGIASPIFKMFNLKIQSGDFIVNKISDDTGIVDCINIDNRTMKLFLYSIFWRVSISNVDLFHNFKINNIFEEEIRKSLLNYKAITHTVYINILKQNPPFAVFPISIVTADTFLDETANVLCALPLDKAYKFLIDKFCFFLFEKSDDIPVDFLKASSNIYIDDARMILFSQNYWHYNIIQPIFDQLAQSMTNI